MIAQRYDHDFTFGHTSLTVSLLLTALGSGNYLKVLTRFCIQILAEFIDNTENICNFVSDNHRLFFCYHLIFNYEDTKNKRRYHLTK